MSITRSFDAEANRVTIVVEDRFDFSQHSAFRSAFSDDPPGAHAYVIDLRRVSYLDSSALGMMLVLRDHAGEDAGRVELLVGKGEVDQILTITNFEKLFSIQRTGV